jgi:transposase InsO family protein
MGGTSSRALATAEMIQPADRWMQKRGRASTDAHQNYPLSSVEVHCVRCALFGRSNPETWLTLLSEDMVNTLLKLRGSELSDGMLGAMPWKESNTMDLRVQLIQDYDEGHSISALAEIYEISRNTVYKWLERHVTEGASGLCDRNRAPLHSPSKLSQEIVAHIVAARHRWNWGPRKLRVKLAEAQPLVVWPAVSTIAEVLKRAGLSHRRKPRMRTPPYAQPFADVDQANQTWCADFKGWFHTGDGTRCDPLTITDAHSRYLLRCHIVPKTDTAHVAAIFDDAFREYGLPLVIHTDNDVPFASRAPGGLSRVSMRWVRLGIVPERSRPASPQDNGRHERMHSTLKQATLAPPERNARRQQAAFERFQHQYNCERPHEALQDRTPASCYAASPRQMPRRIPELEYGDDTVVRRVSQQGSWKWKGERTFVSAIFAYQWLGLRAVDERVFEIFYGPVKLGYLDTRTHRFQRTLSLSLRRRMEREAEA